MTEEKKPTIVEKEGNIGNIGFDFAENKKVQVTRVVEFNNKVVLNNMGLIVEVSSNTDSLDKVRDIADHFMHKMSNWNSENEQKRVKNVGQFIG